MTLTFESLQFIKEQLERKPLLIFGKSGWMKFIEDPVTNCPFTEEQIDKAMKTNSLKLGEWYGYDCIVNHSTDLEGYILRTDRVDWFCKPTINFSRTIWDNPRS